MDSTEEIYKNIYREKIEREEYSHGIIWKAESFFTALISGLITVGFTIAHFNINATYGILFFAIIMTFLGRYVLVTESEYFHTYRYERLKISEKLEYNKLNVIRKFTEFEDIDKAQKDYVKNHVDSERGTRYAFRLVYLFQASICLFVYWALLISSLWGGLLQPIDLADIVLIVILTVIVVLGYRWEIRTFIKNGKKKALEWTRERMAKLEFERKIRVDFTKD